MGKEGTQTDLSAYFMAANRNRLSVAVDIATPDGKGTTRALAAQADVMIENFKPGGLVKYGLGHGRLTADFVISFHISLDTLRSTRTPLCRTCLDWSERISHLAGSLGRTFLSRFEKLSWARRY
jgi:hypothetical protein